jgi:hypothetical protein
MNIWCGIGGGNCGSILDYVSGFVEDRVYQRATVSELNVQSPGFKTPGC